MLREGVCGDTPSQDLNDIGKRLTSDLDVEQFAINVYNFFMWYLLHTEARLLQDDIPPPPPNSCKPNPENTVDQPVSTAIV